MGADPFENIARRSAMLDVGFGGGGVGAGLGEGVGAGLGGAAEA